MQALLLDEDDDFYYVTAAKMKEYGVNLEQCAPSSLNPTFTVDDKYNFFCVEIFNGDHCKLELIKHIKQCQPTARIFVLTANPSIAAAVNAIKMGAENYFSKTAAVESWLPLCMREPRVEEVPSIEALKWRHIQHVLAKTNGNISAAARTLGIARKTLHRKINQYNNTGLHNQT
jgi:two-component system response regulator RegA